MAENSNELMDKLVALCKRRGFIFQSSEIYGGIGGFWDYGPLGVELKRNVKAAWWEDVVRRNDNIVALDCSIIMNPKVWEASGHVGGFSDPMVDCKECKSRFRTDQMELCLIHSVSSIPAEAFSSAYHAQNGSPGFKENPEGFLLNQGCTAEDVQRCLRRRLGSKRAEVVRRGAVLFAEDREARYLLQCYEPAEGDWQRLDSPEMRCPNCGGALTEPREFNLMFESSTGAVKDEASKVYLRPETAQGIFANYRNVLDTSRLKLPFGIAQIGKAFRNEINPRNYTFRSREFEQMEIEFFCHPDAAEKWYVHWRDARFQWYIDHGLKSEKLRLRDHDPDELAHYARACADVEYDFPFGISELEGVANRTDYDLSQHQKFAGRDMTYFDDDLWEADKDKFAPDKFDGDKKAAKEAAKEAKTKLPYRFIPFVIEPSGGVDRATLAFLCEAYTEDEAPDDKGVMQRRVVMKLHPRFAPIKAAVLPLVKKDSMPEVAREIHDALKAAGLASFYDEKGAVGRRYRRQDEAGTPYCITVDSQTLEDRTVTVRDRDSLAQQRIAIDDVVACVQERIKG